MPTPVQLSLFEDENEMPDPLDLLSNGAHLVISISGGKDSDAMAHHLVKMHRENNWTGQIWLIHADLGRAEWETTPEYIEDLSARLDLPLTIVRRDAGDLIDRIWERWYKDPSKPCFPSSEIRYCTSDLKRGPISKEIRNRYLTGDVVCAIGLRAEESKARKLKPVMSIRDDCTTRQRKVYDWLPIHNWSEQDVWDCIETIGGNISHPAYELGNKRLSCACCVLASDGDLWNGATYNPETYRELCLIEAVTGYSFKTNLWLSDIRPDLLPEETILAVKYHKEKNHHAQKHVR